MTSSQIVLLSVLATSGLVVMWALFWRTVQKSGGNVHDILLSPAFFRTVCVMGIIASVVVLTLADKLEGRIAGPILSGLAGYAFGQAGRGLS